MIPLLLHLFMTLALLKEVAAMTPGLESLAAAI